MSFIVEDGSGIDGANAYINVQYIKDYAESIGYSVLGKTDQELESSIVRTTLQYIDVRYKFKGNLLNPNQSLNAPTDEVVIGDRFRRAVSDAVIIELKGGLLRDPSNDALVKKTRRKIADLETETEYSQGIDNNDASPTPVTDALLQPYLASGSGVIGTVQVW